ncbi:MAG: hypothetical protein IT531_00240 [Burkholderiales bacterium]|nr:hypothetical protein [Burkholderiales bacterium]
MNAATVLPIPTKQPKSLESLVYDLLEAKKAEADARDARTAIEDEIIAITGAREEGSETHDAGLFKITVTGKLARSIDWRAYDAIESKIPEHLRPVKLERKLDEVGCRYLEQHEPIFYSLLVRGLTVKRAKTAVAVKGV